MHSSQNIIIFSIISMGNKDGRQTTTHPEKQVGLLNMMIKSLQRKLIKVTIILAKHVI